MYEPTHWLNYPGERARRMTNQVGPTWDGHTLVPVESSYDETTDTTRVGFMTLAGWMRDTQEAQES